MHGGCQVLPLIRKQRKLPLIILWHCVYTVHSTVQCWTCCVQLWWIIGYFDSEMREETNAIWVANKVHHFLEWEEERATRWLKNNKYFWGIQIIWSADVFLLLVDSTVYILLLQGFLYSLQYGIRVDMYCNIKFVYENTVKWGKINQKHAFLQRRPCDICAFCAKLV